MVCSLTSVVGIGIFLASLDVIHGLVTLIFYAYEFSDHYYCYWTHREKNCDFFLYDSDHWYRVNIGIAEGVICIIFSSILIVGLIKFSLCLTWMWLVKAFSVIILNIYFVTVWLIRQGRYYHSFWQTRNEYKEFLYIYIGVGLTLCQILILCFFCCMSVAFTYRVNKRQAADDRIELETTI